MSDRAVSNDPGRTETQMIILSCVYSIPGKLPRSGVAKLLVGSQSERVVAYTDHPDYGRLSHLPRYIVLQEIDALIAARDLQLNDKEKLVVRRTIGDRNSKRQSPKTTL